MAGIHSNTKNCPKSEYRFRLLASFIHPKNPDHRIIQPIKHTSPRGEIIQLFREPGIPRVEYHTEYPASHPSICEHDVVFAERIRRRDLGGYFRETVLVREEVEEGEEH
jgi:hypothetical protein